MGSSWIRAGADGVELEVRLTPRASRKAILGVGGGALRISVQAPPLQDRANRALVEFLAERLELPRRAVTLVSGLRGRMKRVRVEGITEDEVRKRLGILE